MKTKLKFFFGDVFDIKSSYTMLRYTGNNAPFSPTIAAAERRDFIHFNRDPANSGEVTKLRIAQLYAHGERLSGAKIHIKYK